MELPEKRIPDQYFLENLSEEQVDGLIAQGIHLVDSALQYQELMMMYNCAIREVRTKLEVLNADLSVRYQRNPIEFISCRLKKPMSLFQKLQNKNLPLSLSAVESNINDVAGIRVICSFIDDIYAVAAMLTEQDDITLLETKDYIKNPKPNGYRSLHLIVELPVFFSDQKKNMRVEVQIRTIAMDFWASLEHQLKYKKSVKDEESIVNELTECAEDIASIDQRMLAIRNKIDENAESPNTEESLREKLERFNIPSL
ncbi:MAG: GTP pyrophosphokinase family protein [Lachnospiraceae bacterium]|nr:GTP pyrophosphokinase family protein [Lachnospiraceae bacterium]